MILAGINDPVIASHYVHWVVFLESAHDHYPVWFLRRYRYLAAGSVTVEVNSRFDHENKSLFIRRAADLDFEKTAGRLDLRYRRGRRAR